MIASAPYRSSLHYEKQRAVARIHLTTGEPREGCFFVAGGSPWHDGPERICELLNARSGFLPFESHDENGPRTTLVNPEHIVLVQLAEDEASRDPAYVVTRRQAVSMLLSTGERVRGTVRVVQPEGRDRLSDWMREDEPFRYVETVDGTWLVSSAHIVDVVEAGL